MRDPKGIRWAWVLALALLLFATDVSFRARNWADKSWDWQVVAKGLVWLLCGWMGVLRLPRSLSLLAAAPAGLALVFLLVLAVSALWSPFPGPTALAAVAYLGMFAFALACAQVLDGPGLLLALVLGYGAVVLPSLALAPFAAGIAQASPGSTGESGRLRGLTDHPIALAEVSVLFTFASLALRARCRGAGVRLLLATLGAAGAVAALLTWSRIPVVGMMGAVLGVAAFRKGGALLMLPLLGACVAVVLTLESLTGLSGLLPRDLLEEVSRSGHSSEILSVSGRALIWSYALDRIAEAPLLGHGFASGMEVFRRFTPWKVAHAHNALLQSLVYVGALGTLPLLATLATQLRLFLARPDSPRDVFLLYALFSGITEQSMLSNLPSGTGILWLVAVGLAAGAWRKRLLQ